MDEWKELIEQMRHCDMICRECCECKFEYNCKIVPFENVANALTVAMYKLETIKTIMEG